jgi:hypothetical protein
MSTKRLDKSKMPCNKPRPSPNPDKKRVVKACENGKEKVIHYGATGYGHNDSDGARKNFRARHNCDTATSKLTARHWACKDLWTRGGSTAPNPRARGK